MTFNRPDLFFVSEPDPAHAAFGIYRRKGRFGKKFRLDAVMLHREPAIAYARKLKANERGNDFSIVGAATPAAVQQRLDASILAS